MNESMIEKDSLSLKSRILFQNEACIVINKLKGEAVEGAASGMTDLPGELAVVLCANIGRSINHKNDGRIIEAVHRLDVPVTGCALFALTQSSLSFLSAMFTEENSPIKKIYWAIIEKPQRKIPQSDELVHWIETNSVKNKSFAKTSETSGSKRAALHYRITGEGTNYLFAEINLITGRHHQIRAQFAAAGMHIKGDLKYGAKRSEKAGGIRLHARSITFPDPLNKKEKITITADPPQMDNLWEAFLKPVFV